MSMKSLNPLESGRVVKFKATYQEIEDLVGLNPLESGRVVKCLSGF